MSDTVDSKSKQTRTLSTQRLGFVGGGNMAAALVKGLLHARVIPPDNIVVSDVKADRLELLHPRHGVRTTTDNHELVRNVDVVVLAVKPQVVDKVLGTIGGDIRPSQLFISVAAGVPVAAMESRLG